MKTFRISALLLLLCLCFTFLSPGAWALEAPELNGQAALVIDLDTGNVLYEMNSSQRRHPASLTKIMTTLLALEAIDQGLVGLDDVVTAQSDCLTGLAEDSSNAGITPGTQLSMRDLIYCMMLHSANEACNVVASYIGGSIDAFVEMMNQKAQELGCVDTHFANPNGLPAEDHYTTAYELYLICREAMSYPMFMEVADTLSYTVSNPGVNSGAAMNNSNALISPNAYYAKGGDYLYEGASGIKTGYTNAAGYCLVSTATRGDISVMAIAMGCQGELNSDSERFWNFDDSIAMYDWVFDNFSHRDIVDTGLEVATVAVELGQAESVTLRPSGQINVLLPNEVTQDQIQQQVELFSDTVQAPVAAGDVLGRMSYSYEGSVLGTVDLVSTGSVELSRMAYIRQVLVGFFSQGWVIAVLAVGGVFILLYLVLVLRYRRLRKRHLKERRRQEQRRRAEREQEYARQQRQRPRQYRGDPDPRYDRSRDLSRYFDDGDDQGI